MNKPHNTTDPAFTATSASSTTWGSSFNDGWQEVELQIAAQGTTEKRTTFRITGETDQHDKLFRDITIHVLPTQTFNATASSSGSTVTVTITLADDLPSSVFPLEIAFEDSNKRLNPNGTDMPARIGPSIVTGRTDRSYQFIKSVSYADYAGEGGSNVVQCVFKRLSDGSTTLYMDNEYFTKYSININ